MSLASTGLLFKHACTIERNAAVGSDGRGQPNPPDWQTHLADQPCFVWESAGSEIIEGQGTVEPILDLRLLLPASTDVKESDRITSITFRGGTLRDGPLQVRAVLIRPDHLELVLVKA